MSFYICFDKDGQRNQILLQEQIVPSKGSVLINHKYYLLHGTPSQIQWLKEKLPELSSNSDISIEELKSRIEPEIKNFSCSTTMATHTVSMSKLRKQDREKRLLNLMEKAWIPGMSVAVVFDSQVAWTEALGVANFESKEKVTDHTMFEAASLSKPLFAYIVLSLAERGEFDLDKPLYEILPSYKGMERDPRHMKLTARLVLSHRTGLPNWGKAPLEFQFTPDEGFGYSGEGFVYLQKIIEMITGKKLEEIAREEVFEPLGMTSSRYSWEEGEEMPALAFGHNETYTVQRKRIPHEGNSAASLHTTAGDYARFLVAWLGNKRLMRAFYVPPGENKIDWGLGIGVQKTEKRTIAFQWGDNDSFKSFVAINPNDRSAIVYFTNSTNGLAICRKIANEAVGDISQAFDWLSKTCGYESCDTPGYLERHQGLASAKQGNYPEAIAYFEKAIEADSDDKKSQHYIEVITDLIHVIDKPLMISKEVLQRYEGRYGPWRLKLENDKLIGYFNEKKGDMLIPLTKNSFILKESLERIVVYADDDPRIKVYLIDGHVMTDRRKADD